MSEENKALVRRWFDEVLTRGNLQQVDELFAPNYILHGPSISQEVHGREGIRQYVATYRAAFPDAHFTVEDQIAEQDMVVTRWTARGTHQGELEGIAPTGNQVKIASLVISRIAGGKIAEDLTNFDALGLMQQLGVIPPPEQAGA
jgi:steroid delta-isomerase-like uncharacterized protein